MIVGSGVLSGGCRRKRSVEMGRRHCGVERYKNIARRGSSVKWKIDCTNGRGRDVSRIFWESSDASVEFVLAEFWQNLLVLGWAGSGRESSGKGKTVGGVLVRFRRSMLRLKEDELVRGRSQARSRRRGGSGGGGGVGNECL